jgi:acetolactate synthase-1/2/3 large subunit
VTFTTVASGRAIWAPMAAGAVVTCDVGQHQMWVAQYMRFGHPAEHLSSGGLGTMGYGLPAAIGAQMARPEATVVNVTGDGSFLMNVQELATLGRYRLPVKVLVLDNSHLGLVRQQQELFYGERYSECALDDNPDFTSVAEAFGLQARRLNTTADVDDALSWLLETTGPALLHVPIEATDNVWPMVPPGAANTEMMEA